MPELLLELFSEEIPARMQARGADDLARLLGEALAALAPSDMRTFYGPRRIAYAATVADGVAESRQSERGPRLTAPEQALAGFLRKHGAAREALREEGDFWVLDRVRPGQTAAELIARAMPGLLRRFPWPKSMRWGGTSAFTWVRPLRRILCILDGAVAPFDLRQGEDDGHGLRSGNETEGHRFMSPGAFAVTSAAQWQQELRARYVIVDAAERRNAIRDGIAEKASEHGLEVVPDDGLLDEVTGLVEWPVPLLGRIGTEYMDLPPEVMQVSMRVNQRYFALRNADGQAAPWFAFAANIAAHDGGAAIVAGNERVLRARFSDARHFWDLDRKIRLADRVPALDSTIFHAKLGSQGDRVRRLDQVAKRVTEIVNAYWGERVGSNGLQLSANLSQVKRAAYLCKADLTTGMVGEFPELQGIMGGYYANPAHVIHGEDRAVWEAIRDQYRVRLPAGPHTDVNEGAWPTNDDLVAAVLGLADRLDQLVQFFRVGEKPTGSSDPFALRRAALAILRLLEINRMNLPFRALFRAANSDDALAEELTAFLRERLRAKLVIEGYRPDIIDAAFQQKEDRPDHLETKLRALDAFLKTADGRDLLAGFRRAYGILSIENAKGGPHDGAVDTTHLVDQAERTLNQAIEGNFEEILRGSMAKGFFSNAFSDLARLRRPLDEFFDRVVVNSPTHERRLNRLRLLNRVVSLMHFVADFEKVQGDAPSIRIAA